jgi:hypothetical protein
MNLQNSLIVNPDRLVIKSVDFSECNLLPLRHIENNNVFYLYRAVHKHATAY